MALSILASATVACSPGSNQGETEGVFTVVPEPLETVQLPAVATVLSSTPGPFDVDTLPGPIAVGIPPTSTPRARSTPEKMPAISTLPEITTTTPFTPTAVPISTPNPETPTPTSAPPAATPTVVFVPTPSSVPPVASATPAGTSTASPVATIAPEKVVPTATQVVQVTPTPVPAFPIPVLSPDPRYGVVLSSDAADLAVLGISTYVEFNADTSNVPPGTQKLIYINSVNPVPVAEINAAARSKPGSIWYVLGEPNAHGVQPADVVVGLHDTYEAIIAADPTAKITSPSLLNFDYTCDSTCGGYESGRSWAERFLDAYSDVYGESPPIDYWAFDSYPIKWNSVNPLTVDSSIIKSDLVSLRNFLDSRSDESGKPILVTELGIHWGFSAVTFSEPGCGWFPSGTYQEQQVENYFSDVFSWLETNSHQLNIERWFVFSTYLDMSVCRADGGYGLTMFEGAGPGANLSPFGIYFRNWVRGVRP